MAFARVDLNLLKTALRLKLWWMSFVSAALTLQEATLTRPAPAGESAGSGHPLPVGEGRKRRDNNPLRLGEGGPRSGG